MLGDPSAGRVVAASAGLRDLWCMCIRMFSLVAAWPAVRWERLREGFPGQLVVFFTNTNSEL